MRARDVNGHIVNVNSILGHKINTCVPGATPINCLYPPIFHAITAATECIRQEVQLFHSTQIKVTNVSPGLTETDIVATGSDNELIQLMPKLKPEHVANAVIWAICQPAEVQIQEITIKPVGEFL
jgi:NADP+-dependent farnesol dehydrogenase